MPNDPQPATQPAAQPEPQPALNPDELVTKFSETVRSGLRETLSEVISERERRLAQSAVTPPSDPGQNVLAEVVGPVVQQMVGPAVTAISVRAEDAADRAGFYSDPDPKSAQLKAKYRDKIESLFQQELRANRFTPREALWRYLRGGELYHEFVKQELEEAERQRQQAALATTAGPGAPRPLSAVQLTKDPSMMTPEELEKALDGVAF